MRDFGNFGGFSKSDFILNFVDHRTEIGISYMDEIKDVLDAPLNSIQS